MTATITTGDGCRIAYALEGEADRPVLMLSHSLGSDMTMWTPQLDAFSSRFRVLRYDARGHGESTTSPGDYSLDLLGRDVLQLLDALEIEAVDYCGLSLGGMVGQWLGYRTPKRLRRMVIANTSSHVGPPSIWQGRIDTARDRGMAPIVEPTLDRWFTPGFRERALDVVEGIGNIIGATNPQGFAGCAASIRDMDLRPTGKLISAPLLVIAGQHDQGTPPDHAQRIVDNVPGAGLVTLDAAHLSNVEQPVAFTDAVLSFLS